MSTPISEHDAAAQKRSIHPHAAKQWHFLNFANTQAALNFINASPAQGAGEICRALRMVRKRRSAATTGWSPNRMEPFAGLSFPDLPAECDLETTVPTVGTDIMMAARTAPRQPTAAGAASAGALHRQLPRRDRPPPERCSLPVTPELPGRCSPTVSSSSSAGEFEDGADVGWRVGLAGGHRVQDAVVDQVPQGSVALRISQRQ